MALRRSRRSWAALLSCAALFTLFGGVTQSRAEVALSLPLAPVDQAAIQAPRVYFSERSVAFDMVLASGGSCPRILAVLVQQSARLEAEIERQWLFDCERAELSFDGSTVPFTFDFVSPRVKRESRFEWRFGECDAAGTSCRALLETPFEVFPSDLLAPLRDWASREILLVEDPIGELADFLDQQTIDFTLRRSGIAKDSQVVSFLVESEDEIELRDLKAQLDRGAVVLFRERPVTLPLIKSRRVSGQALITVELPLISQLPSSPRAQKALLEIFQMLFERADNS